MLVLFFSRTTVNVLKFQTLSLSVFIKNVGYLRSRVDPDQTVSRRSSLIWVCTVCLGLCSWQHVFQILEQRYRCSRVELIISCILGNYIAFYILEVLKLKCPNVEGKYIFSDTPYLFCWVKSNLSPSTLILDNNCRNVHYCPSMRQKIEIMCT